MRSRIALVAAAATLGVANTAKGDFWTDEILIELGNLTFGVNDTTIWEFDVPVTGTSAQAVVGFSLEFDFVDLGNDFSWASDLEMMVSTPEDHRWVIGQSAFNGGDPFGAQDDVWDFDGPGSDLDGHYASDHFPWKEAASLTDGLWHLAFAQTFDGNIRFQDVRLRLYTVPGPGALALLGIAALWRRRRRA